MPTVPGSDTPFVPEGLGQNAATGPMVEKPSPTNLLMAAATMKDLGRFDSTSADASAGATTKVPHGRHRK